MIMKAPAFIIVDKLNYLSIYRKNIFIKTLEMNLYLLRTWSGVFVIYPSELIVFDDNNGQTFKIPNLTFGIIQKKKWKLLISYYPSLSLSLSLSLSSAATRNGVLGYIYIYIYIYTLHRRHQTFCYPSPLNRFT